MTRRLAWAAGLLAALALCGFVARSVPAVDGGRMPAGLLLLTLAAFALRRHTAPRSRRAA